MRAKLINEAIKHLTPKSDEELKKVHEDNRRDLEDYLHAFGINIKEFDKLGITVTQIDGDNLVIEVYRVLIHKAWATSCYNHENAMKMIKAFKKYAMHNDRKFSIEKTFATISAEYIKKQLKK